MARKTNDMMPAFGQELQRARKDAGLTLDDLAARSGVSKSILSQIERDATNPTLATIWRICGALDVAPQRLFQENETTPVAIERLKGSATPEIKSDDLLISLRILGAIDRVTSLQWYELIAQPGGSLSSDTHGPGTVEHLTILEGSLTVTANGETMSGDVGDTLRYKTDEGVHVISNKTKLPARAVMICDLNAPNR